MQTRSRNLLSASIQPRRVEDEHDNDRSLGIQIKQEILEKPGSLFRPAPVIVNPFLNRDYYYFCYVCNIEMPSLIATLKHRKKLHPNLAVCKKPIKYINQEPDINHPEHYCVSCALKFTKKDKYRKHLKDCHFMVLKTPVIRQDDILPDWNDPRFSCTPCGRGYKSKYKFWEHCKLVHSMKRPEKIPLKVQLPDFHDPNLYCRVCDVTLKTPRKYRAHCHRQHQMNYQASDPDSKIVNDTHCKLCNKTLCIVKSLHIHLFIQHGVENEAAYLRRIKLKPDLNDPDRYCCSCDMTLINQRTFEGHMLTIHSLRRKPLLKEEGLGPDMNDPNNHCNVCDHTYKLRSTYLCHIKRAHRKSVKPTFLYNPNHFPDPLDPSGYCSVCKSQFAGRLYYRSHCRKTHRMVFPSMRINKNPDAKVDVYHPKSYCARCDHYYRDRMAFKTHIKKYHGLWPVKKQEAITQTITAGSSTEHT